MGKTDVLVRMKADTTGYDANIAKARKQLEGFKRDNLSAGGVMKQLTTTFTRAAAGFASAGAAMAAALKVTKDAFMASERTMDEWGRTIQASQSVYEGFLNAINTGDISGFLGRIDQIVTAARAAYDELDRLGTMKTIQGPAVSAQQTENERIRMMIRTGRYIAPVDGRRGSMQNGQILTPDQIRKLEQQLQGGMQKMITLVGNEVKQTGNAIDAYYNSLALQNGMSIAEFRKGTSNMTEFDRRVKGAAAYRKWQDEHSYVDQQTGRLIAPRYGNPYAQYKGWDVFRVDKQGKNSFNELVNLIKQRDQQASQVYGTISQAYTTMNRAEGITVRKLMGGGGSGGASGGISKQEVQVVTGSIDEQTKKVQKLEKAWRAAADDDSRLKIKKQIEEAQFALDIMMGKSSGMPGMNYGLGDLAGNGGSGLFQNPLFKQETNTWKPYPGTPNPWKLDDKAMKAVAEYYDKKTSKTEANLTKEVSNIASGITNVVGGIESLGVELPEGLKNVLNGIQGVISILTGISTIITAIEALTAADTIVPFARGGVVKAAGGFSGVVPGNRFSGDQIPALLNSGEVVLNRAQVGVVADALQNNEGGGRGYTPSHVSGEQIWIALNAFTKRTGRGELVTWR